MELVPLGDYEKPAAEDGIGPRLKRIAQFDALTN
jgi:hypothetical protein